MKRKQFLCAYRTFFAFLTFTAIAVQFQAALDRGGNAVNFFSFFTIESNIFATVMLLVSAVALWAKRPPAELDAWRGAATLYMTITGVVYALLLSGNEEALQTTIPWVNIVLHYLLPVVMLGDWLLAPPARRISLRAALTWLVFPIVFVGYSLVRGPSAQWYPYPFLDPRPHGYGAVWVYALCIAVAAVLFAALVRAIGNLRVAKTRRR